LAGSSPDKRPTTETHAVSATQNIERATMVESS